MITIEDITKINLKIGEVKNISKGHITINFENKDYIKKIKLEVKKGDKIVIAHNQENITIPLINKNIPLIPEKDIEAGSKIR